MCTVKTPKPQTPVTPKEPVYLRNPFLDGLGINGESRGRSSLRIDLGSTTPTPHTGGGLTPSTGALSPISVMPTPTATTGGGLPPMVAPTVRTGGGLPPRSGRTVRTGGGLPPSKLGIN